MSIDTLMNEMQLVVQEYRRFDSKETPKTFALSGHFGLDWFQ